jgi:protein-tyrosine phosphatase
MPDLAVSSVLFVCLGNICRSPLGEGVLRHLVAEHSALTGRVETDSAGTAAYHTGESPDLRSIEAAARHGVSLAGQSARPVEVEDFHRFDLILAMDAENLKNLEALRPAGSSCTLRRLRDYDPAGAGDVPDPYYGGSDGFEDVFKMVHRSCVGLLAEIDPR